MIMDHADVMFMQQSQEIGSDIPRIQLAIAHMPPNFLPLTFDDRLPERGQQHPCQAARGMDIGTVLCGLQSGTEDPAHPAARLDNHHRPTPAMNSHGRQNPRRRRPVNTHIGVQRRRCNAPLGTPRLETDNAKEQQDNRT